MPTRREVLDIIEAGGSYDEAAGALGIDAGLAYMIATGLPADGSDTLPIENPTQKDRVQAWIRARVQGDAPMRTAAAKRGTVPKPPPDPDDERDVITVLTRDHNYVSTLMKQLQTTPTASKGASRADIDRRAAIVATMIGTLALHESVEEQFLWPAVRDVLAGGGARADEALAQEQHGNDLLHALAQTDPATKRFDELTEELELAVRRHVTFEEQVFLDLERGMDLAARRKIGERIHAAEASGRRDKKGEEA